MVAKLALIFCFMAAGLFKADDIPEFKGGTRSLNDFVARNLIYPEYSKQNCLQGTIQVSFQLNKQGKIVRSKVQNGFGTDLDAEALRIIRLTSGRWNIPSAFDTTQAIIIPINFSLKEYNCAERSKEDIKKAISAYHSQQNIVRAIIIYHKNKSSGTYNADYESQILKFKKQLGYNERYYDQLLKDAKRKLKQGDKESACEDFNLIRNLGSDKANKLIEENCR